MGVLQITEDAHANFKTLADRWLDSRKHKLAESTAEWYGYLIKNLAEFFGDASIRNITVQDCERWAATRRKTAGTKAFVSELDTMNAVFQYAVRHGLILTSPAAHVERPTVRQPKIQVPSLTDFRQIVAAIRESDGRPGSQQRAKTGADLVELLAYSGARVAEITGGPKKKSPLRWSHVDFNNNTVFLPGTKTESAPRWIPMSPELRSILERLKTEKNPAPGDAVISISDARTCLETACRKLGFPKYTHHDFRHFFATTCIESGVDIPTVSRWLGHGDGGALAMKRYGHLRQEHSLAMSKRVSFDKPANCHSDAECCGAKRQDANTSQRLMKDAPLPTPKRNMGILGGRQKIRWRFFGDNSTRKQELFRSRNSLKSPSKRWAGRFSNRN